MPLGRAERSAAAWHCWRSRRSASALSGREGGAGWVRRQQLGPSSGPPRGTDEPPRPQQRGGEKQNGSGAASRNREAVISRPGGLYLVTCDASQHRLHGEGVCNQSPGGAAQRARSKPEGEEQSGAGFRHPRAVLRQGVTARVIQRNGAGTENPAVSMRGPKGLLHPPACCSPEPNPNAVRCSSVEQTPRGENWISARPQS